MCVGNIHEPQAGVDVTKVPTEGQTQTLRRHSEPVTPPRIRNVDDDGRYEEEAPDNSTTDDEDDHMDKETGRYKLRRPRRPRSRASMLPPTPSPTTATANKETTRLSTTTKTPTSTKKAATTQTATPAATTSQKTIQRTSQNRGSDYKKRTTHTADHMPATNRITSWIPRQSQMCWREG